MNRPFNLPCWIVGIAVVDHRLEDCGFYELVYAYCLVN